MKDLVVKSGSGCTSSEVVRMEKIILGKLQWELFTATGADFLNIVSKHPPAGVSHRGETRLFVCDRETFRLRHGMGRGDMDISK